MKKKILKKLRSRKRRIARRLARARRKKDTGKPVMGRQRVGFEVSERARAIAHGGLGAVLRVVALCGLVRRLDERVHVLKVHRPYHESDHVLNIAYNTLCGGRTLDDIELRRNDEVFLDALGVEAIPDPTTAGDFCRRFEREDIEDLMEAVNETLCWVLYSSTQCLRGPALFVVQSSQHRDGDDLATFLGCFIVSVDRGDVPRRHC